MELKMRIIKFKINPLEDPFVSCLILNRASLGPNLPKKHILGTKFEKTIATFKISALEYPFVPNFILNKTLIRFGTKFAPKSILRAKIRKIKCPSTLFWVNVKQFTRFGVIVHHSVNSLDHCGSLQVIVAHSVVQYSPIKICYLLWSIVEIIIVLLEVLTQFYLHINACKFRKNHRKSQILAKVRNAEKNRSL